MRVGSGLKILNNRKVTKIIRSMMRVTTYLRLSPAGLDLFAFNRTSTGASITVRTLM